MKIELGHFPKNRSVARNPILAAGYLLITLIELYFDFTIRRGLHLFGALIFLGMGLYVFRMQGRPSIRLLDEFLEVAVGPRGRYIAIRYEDIDVVDLENDRNRIEYHKGERKREVKLPF